MARRIYWNRYDGNPLPENTVLVTRGTKWGNPFKIDRKQKQIWVRVPGPNKYEFLEDCEEEADLNVRAVSYYKLWIMGHLNDKKFNVIECPFTKDDIIEKLAGKDLACTCKQKDKCHGDLLLKIANEKIWEHLVV